ncbi:MAG TPA: pyrroloquinoline quinone biosynthesis peptide chaperone PqqD [Polyangiaceae bacterium]|nr:pyrroloquinoline quinone biosynthesis peptide chaperone PqqD [Polyangiaceae bacterium]
MNAEGRPRLAARARLRWDQKTGQHMLLYPERGMHLNATAQRVVELCDGTKTVAQLLTALAAQYQAPVVALEGEVRTFLQALTDKGLLDWSGGAP